MAKRDKELDLLEGFAWMGGLAALLELAGFVGELLDKLSEGARHELVDAFAATHVGQTYAQALKELNAIPERRAVERAADHEEQPA